MSLIDVALIFIGGCAGGLMAGLLGVGGGIIFVVILNFYLEQVGVPASLIVPAVLANSLFAIFFSGVSASIKQVKDQNFFPRAIFTAALPAAFCSMCVTFAINQGNWYTRERFSLFFVALLGFIVFRMTRKKSSNTIASAEIDRPYYLILAGSIAGVISAFSGVGGGVIMVPLFVNWLKMPLKKATGVSLGVITVMSLLITLYSMFFSTKQSIELPYTAGLIVFPVALPMVLGTILCSPMGVSLGKRMKESSIRVVFLIFVSVVMIKMLYSIVF